MTNPEFAYTCFSYFAQGWFGSGAEVRCVEN